MSKWIDINDDPPPLHKFVLVTDKTINIGTNGLVTIARRIGHGHKAPIWWCGYIDTFHGHVTHWMAYPNPPSKEKP